MGSINNPGHALSMPVAVPHHKFLDDHQSLYDGMMGDAINPHLASSKAAAALHLLPPHTLKRTVPNLYWNDDAANTSPSTKRFLAESCDGRGSGDDATNSIATILSQLPQTPSTLQQQQQAMLGNLDDGVFGQQPYQVNWYT